MIFLFSVVDYIRNSTFCQSFLFTNIMIVMFYFLLVTANTAFFTHSIILVVIKIKHRHACLNSTEVSLTNTGHH